MANFRSAFFLESFLECILEGFKLKLNIPDFSREESEIQLLNHKTRVGSDPLDRQMKPSFLVVKDL